MQALSAAQGGDTGEDAVIGKGGFEIAALSAGGAIAAVDAVMAGRVTNACMSVYEYITSTVCTPTCQSYTVNVCYLWI
jgi:hypothetical protein